METVWRPCGDRMGVLRIPPPQARWLSRPSADRRTAVPGVSATRKRA